MAVEGGQMTITHYHDPDPRPYDAFDFECSKRFRSLRNSQEDMLERRVLTIVTAIGAIVIGALHLL
jgi:hypothetical protein